MTFEFENVPAEAAAAAAEYTRVRPGGSVLHITQHRFARRRFWLSAGIPVTPFTPVDRSTRCSSAIAKHGCPAILKTAGFGYDGKGQVFIRRPENAGAAWDAIARCPAVLESFVDFEREISVVAARGLDGSFAHFPPSHNEHHRTTSSMFRSRPRRYRNASRVEPLRSRAPSWRSSTSSACSASSSS